MIPYSHTDTPKYSPFKAADPPSQVDLADLFIGAQNQFHRGPIPGSPPPEQSIIRGLHACLGSTSPCAGNLEYSPLRFFEEAGPEESRRERGNESFEALASFIGRPHYHNFDDGFELERSEPRSCISDDNLRCPIDAIIPAVFPGMNPVVMDEDPRAWPDSPKGEIGGPDTLSTGVQMQNVQNLDDGEPVIPLTAGKSNHQEVLSTERQPSESGDCHSPSKGPSEQGKISSSCQCILSGMKETQASRKVEGTQIKKSRKKYYKPRKHLFNTGFKRTNDLSYLSRGYDNLETRLMDITTRARASGKLSKEKQRLWNQISSLKNRLKMREHSLMLEGLAKSKDRKTAIILKELEGEATPSQMKLILFILSQKWAEAEARYQKKWPLTIEKTQIILRGRARPAQKPLPKNEAGSEVLEVKPSAMLDPSCEGLMKHIETPDHVFRYFLRNEEAEE